MRKNEFFLSVLVLFVSPVFAQQESTKKTGGKEKGVSVSVGANFPVGEFTSTHLIGIAIDCSPSTQLYGITNKKKITLTYNGGMAYYPGKKETVSSYSYKYPGYLFFHGFGGLQYKPVKKAGISLTAGPALGLYNGNTQFNIGSRLEASYHLKKTLAIGSGIILMKEMDADPVWAVTLKAIVNL